ncbi:MAG: hypothetical protein AEth_00416 [Candidatus Argoarchaeum ethanivorans]|uniref:Transposase n=1 Tax=Candidatus Argoarchaeum ethanivorans TaxID=2608793 RepID=A0A8B3S793_9EURY|nr:MAG: hypothetical protein AEth_00416 [Candidatus Argoarchaeum ethanivorans]
MLRHMIKEGHTAKNMRATLRSLRSLASPSARSYNRYISDFANAPSKFLATLETSHTPQPLSEIGVDTHLRNGFGDTLIYK